MHLSWALLACMCVPRCYSMQINAKVSFHGCPSDTQVLYCGQWKNKCGCPKQLKLTTVKTPHWVDHRSTNFLFCVISLRVFSYMQYEFGLNHLGQSLSRCPSEMLDNTIKKCFCFHHNGPKLIKFCWIVDPLQCRCSTNRPMAFLDHCLELPSMLESFWTSTVYTHTVY